MRHHRCDFMVGSNGCPSYSAIFMAEYDGHQTAYSRAFQYDKIRTTKLFFNYSICALLKQHAPDLLEMSEFTRVKVNISQTS